MSLTDGLVMYVGGGYEITHYYTPIYEMQETYILLLAIFVTVFLATWLAGRYNHKQWEK